MHGCLYGKLKKKKFEQEERISSGFCRESFVERFSRKGVTERERWWYFWDEPPWLRAMDGLQRKRCFRSAAPAGLRGCCPPARAPHAAACSYRLLFASFPLSLGKGDFQGRVEGWGTLMQLLTSSLPFPVNFISLLLLVSVDALGEVCHKSYTQFSNLCRHKRMHADCRTQIKCKDCGQMFSTTSSLNKHRRFCEGKNHYSPGGIFAPGLPLTPTSMMDKSKPSPNLNHASLGFNDYFPSRPHPGGLPFSPAPPAFPALTPGFPGIFPPSLYPRPPLLPPTQLLKSPLNHTQDAKLPSPLGNPALPLISAVSNSNQAASGEEKCESSLENSYLEKLKARNSDMSDGSDFEDVNTTTGTDLDTTTGTGSDLDSDAESDRDKTKDKSKQMESKPDFVSSSVSASSNNNTSEIPLFYSQHSFFPPPEEHLLPTTGAANDSIKAIASIAEKYFGPGFMGMQEKKMGSLPYHSMFPFQFLPNFPHSLYPFTERTLNHNLLVKAEPKSPRDLHKVGSTSSESPFDLTTKPKEIKPILPPPKVLPAPSSGEEQPLDLSIGNRIRASQNGGREPRKNHIYGERKLMASEVLPKISQSQLPQQPSLHYAKPSPFFMDPIYRY